MNLRMGKRISTRLAFAAVALAVGYAAQPAHATAIFSANATAVLRVIGITDSQGNPLTPNQDVIVEGDFNQPLMDLLEQEQATGNASANASGGAQVFAGGVEQTGPEVGDGLPPGAPFGIDTGTGLDPQDGVKASASASGQADPIGEALAGFFANASVFLTNETFDDALVQLALDFAFDGLTSVDNPGSESATASIRIQVIGAIAGEIIDIEQSTSGNGSFSDSGRQIFTVELGGLFDGDPNTEDLLLLVDATGRAVPEPGSLALLGAGLLALGGLIGRSRRAAAA